VTDSNPSAIERTYQRRRLGVLAGVLLVVLGLAPLLDRPDAGPVRVAAGDPADQRVRIAGIGSPTAVRELLSQTTTTLVEASGATTSTTAPPTTAAPAPTTTTAVAAEVEPAPTTTSRAVAIADEDDPEPTTTTAAPATTSPPTTAAPRPTTTTTAPPPPPPTTSAPTEGGYADDDPRGTQVWYDLAECESGGNWSIDTGNGYYGGLQFSLATWESVGGTGYPHEHPVATQIEMGRRLQARQGWGAWPHCSEQLGLR